MSSIKKFFTFSGKKKKAKTVKTEFSEDIDRKFNASKRSFRSGYAFANQEGFGELITSGRRLRDNPTSPIFALNDKVPNKPDDPVFSKLESLDDQDELYSSFDLPSKTERGHVEAASGVLDGAGQGENKDYQFIRGRFKVMNPSFGETSQDESEIRNLKHEEEIHKPPQELGKSDQPVDNEVVRIVRENSENYDEITLFGAADIPVGKELRKIADDISKKQKSFPYMSDVSLLSASELIQRAEDNTLALDLAGIKSLKEKFVSMDARERRKYYKCGEDFLIHEQISPWQLFSKTLEESRFVEASEQADAILNQKVALFYGDITRLEVGCVVNSTDTFASKYRTGVNAVIVEAAGQLLPKEYYLYTDTDIREGECVMTAGYQLPAKYILHVCGPSLNFSTWDGSLKLLGDIYKLCLNRMHQLGQRTVAFPCISSGAKGIPSHICSDTALGAVKEWLLEEDNKDKVDKIIFCIYDEVNWKNYCTKMFSFFPPSKEEESHEPASSLPVEILRMDSRAIDLYKTALEEGEETVYNIRVMIIGHFGVGKTTLARRLLGENVDLKVRDSTNGIDVHVCKCKVSLSDHKWHLIPPDEKTESTVKRLAKMLASRTTKGNQDVNPVQVAENNIQNQADTFETPESATATEAGKDIDMVTDHMTSTKVFDSLEATSSGDISTVDRDGDEDDENAACIKDLKDMIAEMMKTGKFENMDMADVSLWDFAGQSVFYTTHLMFLSVRAVYLLVTDISKHIDDVVMEDECYFDSAGPKQCSISGFVDFWLNSIHSCAPEGSDDTEGIPPVILVGTHADKLTKDTVDGDPYFCPEGQNCYRQKLADAYFEAVRNHLSEKPTLYHLSDEDFDIDNTIEDPKLEALKKKIVEVAVKQPYWGERIPAKWLPLERALKELKEKGVKIVDFSFVETLNQSSAIPISTTEELELFLRFQHESGNILYFCEEALKDKVVLDPQWLVDALKTVITAKMFCLKKPKVLEKWQEFNRCGILRPELLDAVWQKDGNPSFHENREHLLALMEKLNLISRPKLWLPEDDLPTEKDYHLAPCMLRDQPPDTLLTPCHFEDCKSTSILVFTFIRKFVPNAVFHRLLSACLAKWSLWRQGKKDLIFCGCGVFKINTSHKLSVIFKDYTIQIWVTKFGRTEKFPRHDVCVEVREFIEESLLRITGGLTQSSHFQVGIRCPDSSCNEVDAMVTVEDLQKEREVVCSWHTDSTHVISSKEVLKYWYKTGGHPGENMGSPFPLSEGEEMPSCLSFSLLKTCPTDQDLCKIANRIGKEFQQLGLELGIPLNVIEIIRMENMHIPDQILNILIKWREMNACDATFRCLETAMRAVNIDTLDVFKGFDCDQTQ